MFDTVKDEFILKIRKKLYEGTKLDDYEVRTIVAALMKERGVTQTPYYEIVFHDEYNMQEHRVMNPVSSEIIEMEGYFIQKDKFELSFQRLIK